MGAKMLLLISLGMALLGGLHGIAPVGQEFITAFMQNYKMNYPGTQFQLFISGYASSTKVTVSVYKSQFRSNFVITRGQTQVVTIPTYVEMSGTAKFCNTVLVRADQDISVLALSSKENSADTHVVYPVKNLGSEYYILTPPGDGDGLYKEFSIITWRDPVEVEIFLKGSVRFRERVYTAGSKLSVSLLPYEAVQFQSRQDLSGTHIRSSQPVAVLSGHSCARKNTKCNYVVEQLLPVTSWGRAFFVPPLSFQMTYDIAYIIASQTTLITYFSGEVHKNQLLVAGTVFQLEVKRTGPLYISASAGIQVFFFCTGGSHNGIAFDPFFLSIPDVSSYCTSYSLMSQKGFENYVLIIAKKMATAGIAMDGRPLAGVSWEQIPGSEYVWGEYSLGSGESQHTMGHPDTPFGLLSFGIADRNGYGAVARCQGASQLPPKPSCSSTQCRKKEACQILNGHPVCVAQSSATCWALGDPHYQTFDKRNYNFMGTCTYTMAKTCGSDPNLPAFHIMVKNENRGSQTVSYVGSVTVQVYGHHISVARNEYGLVRVNNQRSRLPISLHDGKLSLYQSGSLVIIETNFSLKVFYDWNSYLVVKISSSFSENMCGLCGNYNGDPADDFRTASGSLAPSPVEFGRSWKVEDGDQLCWDDCHGECTKVNLEVLVRYKVELFCGWISKKEGGPFSQCHSVIDPEIFVDNCAYDLYIYKGHREALCQSLKSYADACQREGVVLSDWRALTGCPLPCPENSRYVLCGSACPATCNDQAAPTKCSSLPCVETCQCNEGFVLDAGKCIPQSACGCVFEGKLFSPKEEFWGDGTCTRRCLCDPQTKQVTCRTASCKSGEQCRVENGIQNCYPTGYGTCAAIGYSHYHTFDGQSFNFQGTCLYQFAGVSTKSQELVDFQVLVQNSRQGGWSLSLNKLVKVQVYGTEITLSWAYRGRIMVNGLLTHLPYRLGLEQILVYRKGWNVVMLTDFGLTVTFDWQSRLTVTVPRAYAGVLNGLCGNFNGNKQDDLTPRDAGGASLITSWGQRWRVAESQGCGEMSLKVCPGMEAISQRQRSISAQCGLLVDKSGPFRECHSKIDPETFFLDCVYDFCMFKGQQAVLGHVIAAYAMACQTIRVTIYVWRIHIFWKPVCPQNSHYELCARGCQQTCTSLYSPLPCSAHCAEGCVCDPGFVLSGDRCVPMSECGCVYQDRYYSAGQTFHPTQKCDLQCMCQAGGAVTCKKFSCGPNEVCRLVDGIQKCHSVRSETCLATGDSHYTTFDKLHFNFQGSCTYVFAKTCSTDEAHMTPFTVKEENKAWESGKVSVTKMISVEVYDTMLTLLQEKKGLVKVNGVFQPLPIALSNGHLRAYQHGENVVIQTNFGLMVRYNMRYRATVTIPSSYQGQMCGLCGNYNGQKDDDFLLPDGTTTTDVAVFGVAWKVSVPGALGSCSDGCSGNTCPICEEKKKDIFKLPNYCGMLNASAFSACHSKVDPSVYLHDCIYDLCQGNGDSQVLCQSIESYVSACHEAGVSVQPWRTPSFCPLSCPPNSHYELCADLCSVHCASINESRMCPETCSEGCQCDDGFFFDGLACVTVESCGCSADGRYYEPHKTVLQNECQERCSCLPGRGVVCESHSCRSDETCKIQDGIMNCVNRDPCKTLKCRTKETCKLENGRASCVPAYNGTCWGWGDPHYHTFDGREIDFQGTCTYTIAKYSGSDSGLVPFQVDEKNDNRGSQAISFVKITNIYVYGHNISIHRKEVGKIRLNGVVTNLPVTLEEGKMQLFQSGLQAVLQTDFGLVVSYDWSMMVEITLPSSYYGATCGLCGNFNQNPDDDMLTPTGETPASAVEWGRSWKVKDRDPFCWDFCQGDCPVCEERQRRLFESEEFCGLIAKVDGGPFRKCHSKLNPDDFFDSCVYDVCLNGGAKNILCQALSAYATNCHKEGVVIQDWRAQSGCALPCPENSHYEACGNACPASCADRSAPSTCSRPCLETCQCNEGYVLSADKCVPVGSCGCTHNGLYYKPGEELWADEACSSRCRCDPSLGMMVCQLASCKASERCAMVDGVRGCHARSHATCSAAGDHHYTTFDGQRYDFTGTCVYQLVGLRASGSTLTPFTVKIQNSQGSKTAPFSSVVTLEVYNRTITISQQRPHTIQVDGMFVDLPFYHEDKVKAYISGAHVLVTTRFDLTVTFGWNRLVRVTLPNTYSNAVCGLCGNDNGEPGDDLTMKDGRQAANVAQFAESWKVGEIPGCVNGCTSNCPVCKEAEKQTYEGDQYCGILTKKDGPFKACHEAVYPVPYLSNCVLDACQYKGHHEILCHAISAYVAACQAQGIHIGQWRSASFCSPSCPRNSHYELCGNGCPTTCHGLSAPDGCQVFCKEGCYCNAGFVLSGDQCVPIGECGCVHQGRYYKKGMAFFPSPSCRERCRCMDNGAVECQRVSCGDNEECRVQEGVQGCHPIGCGKCSVSGGSHYLTFDRQILRFPGSCTYTLAKVCSQDPGLVQFSVVVENESAGAGKAVTKEVVVTTHGYTISLVKGMNGKVQVDGEIFAVPLVIGRRKAWVTQEGKNLVIQTDFGLKVLYDPSYYVLVSVPVTYRGHMCGLCGNFNGDKSDELLLPDEKTTQNVTEFGMSWKVPVSNAACSDGCGQNCPDCSSIKTSPYQEESSCGLIVAKSGPFRDCHPVVRATSYFDLCLYSMCAAGGAKEILCQSLQAYVTVCQAAGVKIEAWRTPSFCPLSCPANSHYEPCSRSCDLTCAALSAAPSLCTKKCFEGCQCDGGYVSDGETCAPMGKCGCVHNGRYIKAEESIISEDCSEKCTCHASGRLACTKFSCKTGETCALQKGVRGCVKQEAQCSLAVGGQLTSFDGASGEILSVGAYEVASLCNSEDQSWFRVIVDVRSCSDGEVMAGAAVYIFFRETFIAINKDKQAWVNGRPVQLPLTVSEAVSVRLSQDVITVSQGTALQVLFGLRGEVTVKVKASLEGKMCASCGNFNGDSADDLRLPNGKMVGNVAEVIDAWKARDFWGCEQ